MNIDHCLIRLPEQTHGKALWHEVFKISRIIQAVDALKMGEGGHILQLILSDKHSNTRCPRTLDFAQLSRN
jgi:hypothetical protein